MRKLSLVAILALCCMAAAAKKPVVTEFKAAVDSMKVLMKERTGVSATLSLERIRVTGKRIDFYFSRELGDYPWRPGDDVWFRKTFLELSGKIISAYTPGEIYARKENIRDFPMPALSSDGKPVENGLGVQANDVIPLVKGDDAWPLGLSGRHIAIWQSHGRFWDASEGRWKWQRAGTHSTAEDLFSQSFVLPFLIPMLENAGAVTITPRERDIQPYEVVCDNDPAFADERTGMVRRRGSYKEYGAWQDAGAGFADSLLTYRDHDNPFTMGSARRTVSVKNAGSRHYGEAMWIPDIPEDGEYAVYISYKSLPGSATGVPYLVHHSGGDSYFRVNQKMGGGTWVYLGTFPFKKGSSGYVKLTNVCAEGGVVTADAVRFGGGIGKTDRGGGTSGLPAFVEGALYSMQYGGTDLSLFDKWEDDYTKDFAGRGLWVQDLRKRGIPFDMSLAFHTDAGITPNDSIIGTLAIYTYRSEEGTRYDDGSSRLNGRLLSDFVQTQVVDDIRSGFEPRWTRRQTWDRSYSESRTTTVPGMLLELLSHQNFADMRYGLDPAFRFTASRAVYKGMLKYLSARYGCEYAVQPLPVHNFKVRLDGDDAVLSWSPTTDSLEVTASPRRYRVYTRIGDGAFDSGHELADTTFRMHLEAGMVYSFKVAALNDGGLSFPSEILAAGIPSCEAGKVMIVNNFTRVSAPSSFDTPEYAGFTHDLDSGVPWGKDILFLGKVNEFRRSSQWTTDDNPGFGGTYSGYAGMPIAGNSFDFVSAHGQAVLDAGYAFESSSAEAWDGASGDFAVDIICGKQLTTRIGSGAVPDRYKVFTPQIQDAIRRFTASGGNVIISGSYIATDAWDSVYQGVPKAPESTRTFIQETLGYKWVTNFPDITGMVVPSPGSEACPAGYNREFSSDIYRVENPDGIAPANASGKAIMEYSGTRIGAAVLFDGNGYKAVSFGFPLEASTALGELMDFSLKQF